MLLGIPWPAFAAVGDPPAPELSPSSALPLLRLEAIEVVGADAELDMLVRRNLILFAGSPVDRDLLVEARDRLQATGYFDEVHVYTRRGTEPGRVVAMVEAKLGKRLRLETGVGHETLNGWYLNLVGVRWTSPFGRGGVGRIGLHDGLNQDGLFADLEIPKLGRPEHDLRFDIALLTREWVAYDEDLKYIQFVQKLRALAGLRHRHGPDVSATIWMGYLGVVPGDTLEGQEDQDDEPVGRLVPKTDHSEDFLDGRLEILWDARDRARPWQDGLWAGLRLRAADRISGAAFWSAEGDVRLAVPVAGTRAAAFRARWAWTGPGTPYHQRFVVGGVRSLRGFATAGLSGPLGAQALWQATAEWRQPLAGDDPRRPRVLGTLFLDVGDHWDSERARQGVSASVGYGAQFQIPWLQVLNFEVAYPLTTERTGNTVTGRISLGRSF